MLSTMPTHLPEVYRRYDLWMAWCVLIIWGWTAAKSIHGSRYFHPRMVAGPSHPIPLLSANELAATMVPGKSDLLVIVTVKNSNGDPKAEIPANFTSPPTRLALALTPEPYQSDEFVQAARMAAASNKCTTTDNKSRQHTASFGRCHIPFGPNPSKFSHASPLGVIFYPGGLVDPRSYAPLAHRLAHRYGLPVIIPIFAHDLAFLFDDGQGPCNSGRLALAQAEFPLIQKWVLAGHSLGGVAAMADAWALLTNDDNNYLEQQPQRSLFSWKDASPVAGLVMIAADVHNDLRCGDTDFSRSNLPMAAVTASLDGRLNWTRWESNRHLLSNATWFVDIWGGNHGQFGSYEPTHRHQVLNQTDGIPEIPPEVQWDATVTAIYHVASRSNLSLPQRQSLMGRMFGPFV